MRTMLLIMAIVIVAGLTAVGITVALILWLGSWTGLGIAAGAAGARPRCLPASYPPWQHGWGATDGEVASAMAGDDLLPGATGTTRAIGIAAQPQEVWPWLVQIGYGRAGWYSHDWIDNDFRPSAVSSRSSRTSRWETAS